MYVEAYNEGQSNGRTDRRTESWTPISRHAKVELNTRFLVGSLLCLVRQMQYFNAIAAAGRINQF